MTSKNSVSIGPLYCWAFVLISLSLLVDCKGQQGVETHWSEKSIQIDGQMTDWAGTPTTFFEESAVQLGLSNDSEELFILFRFTNQMWARLIRMGGLTLWVDNSGEKKNNSLKK